MATRRRETRVERRVRRALKKYVRRRKSNAGPKSWRRTVKRIKKSRKAMARELGHEYVEFPSRMKAVWKDKQKNPPRVKGRKVKGGRAVTLRKFTGTIVRKKDGTVEILGRGRK